VNRQVINHGKSDGIIGGVFLRSSVCVVILILRECYVNNGGHLRVSYDIALFLYVCCTFNLSRYIFSVLSGYDTNRGCRSGFYIKVI